MRYGRVYLRGLAHIAEIPDFRYHLGCEAQKCLVFDRTGRVIVEAGNHRVSTGIGFDPKSMQALCRPGVAERGQHMRQANIPGDDVV